MVGQIHRFTRRERISRSQTIRETLQSGRCVHGKQCALYWRDSETTSRMGVVVSRKTAPLATRRNQLKRWAREFWRLNQHRFNGSQEAIVRFKTSIADSVDWKILSQELETLFAQAGFFGEKKK